MAPRDASDVQAQAPCAGPPALDDCRDESAPGTGETGQRRTGSLNRPADGIPQTLARIGYFRGMAQHALHRLGAKSHFMSLRKDDVLVARGRSAGRNVYALLEGQVILGLPTSGSLRAIRFVDPGMTFGESALLMHVHPPYEAVATLKSRVLVIDGNSWLREIETMPQMTLNVLTHLAQRRLEFMEMLEARSRPTHLSRVAGYLLTFRPKLQSESFSFQLPAKKMAVAAHLGMSNASFSRALQQLKKDRLVEVNGSFIHVLNVPSLEKVAQRH